MRGNKHQCNDNINEYEYLGFFLDEQADCMHHIQKKGNDLKGQIVALKSVASYSNVGPLFVSVRLELFELCTIHSLLYGIEAWNKQTKKEIKELEKQQAKALCSLLQLPRSTPYLGILNETGIWKVEERINYRRIMLVQNILKSDDRRLCKRLLVQQAEEGDDDTLYATTKAALDKYGIEIRSIASMKKSQLKKMVKEEIEKEMNRMIQKAAENMTKLRFIKGDKFGRKSYMEEMDGQASLLVLKTRLNMLPVYKNYKGDMTLNKMCQYCFSEEDSTEHLVDCKELGRTMLSSEDIKNTNNKELWRQLIERITFNLENRRGIDKN